MSNFKNRIIITIILFTLFYAIFAIYSDIDKVKEIFQQIKIIYIIPILTVLTFSVFIRSLLQRFLLSSMEIKISMKQSFILFLSGLSMLITPGGAGQMIKSHFLEQKYNHPVSKSLPLIFVERFSDFVIIVIMISVTLFVFYSLSSFVIVILSLIFLICIFVTVKNKKIFHIIESTISKINFLHRVFPNRPEFYDSVQKIFSTPVIMRSLIFTSITFLLEGLVIYFCFLAFSIDLGYLKTFQIYYTSVLFGTLSFIPGGVGVLEGSFVNLLIQRHLELPLVTALIIFIRLNTMWYVTALGFIATTYFKITKKDLNET